MIATLFIVILLLFYSLLYYFWRWVGKEKNDTNIGFSFNAALLAFITGTVILLFFLIIILSEWAC